jgi:hypothetical protein
VGDLHCAVKLWASEPSNVLEKERNVNENERCLRVGLKYTFAGDTAGTASYKRRNCTGAPVTVTLRAALTSFFAQTFRWSPGA